MLFELFLAVGENEFTPLAESGRCGLVGGWLATGGGGAAPVSAPRSHPSSPRHQWQPSVCRLRPRTGASRGGLQVVSYGLLHPNQRARPGHRTTLGTYVAPFLGHSRFKKQTLWDFSVLKLMIS